jgi:hypothetical protein
METIMNGKTPCGKFPPSRFTKCDRVRIMETIMNGKTPCGKFPPSKFGTSFCSNSRSSRYDVDTKVTTMGLIFWKNFKKVPVFWNFFQDRVRQVIKHLFYESAR